MKSALMKHLRKWVVPLAVVLIGTAGVVAAALLPERARDVPPGERPRVNVAVMPIEPLPTLPDRASYPAFVEPNRTVRLSAEVGGRIERIPAVEGRPVEAGEVIVEINTDFLQAAYDAASAQAEFAESEYRRISDLTRRDVATEKDLEQVRSEKRRARASLDEAQARLDRAVVRAPSPGDLHRLPVEVGEVVGQGTLLAQIVDVDRVKVVFHAPERDVGFFRLDQEATVERERDRRLESWEGRIWYIGTLADERTRTTRVEILVDNPDRSLISGQIVRARLVRRELEDVVMIPLAAVIPADEGHMVYVAEEDEARPRTVELGMFTGRHVQVLSGLERGDRLIVSGHRLVGPGQGIEVQETQSPVSADDLVGQRRGQAAPGRTGE